MHTLSSSADYGTDNSVAGEGKRRNRWSQGLLVGSTAPPQGVDPAGTPSNGPSSPSNHGDSGTAESPQGVPQPRPQGPLTVKSKQPNRLRNNGRMPLSKVCCMRFMPDYKHRRQPDQLQRVRPIPNASTSYQRSKYRRSHSSRHNCPHHGNIPTGGGRAARIYGC